MSFTAPERVSNGRELTAWGWGRHKSVLGDTQALRGLLRSICNAVGMQELLSNTVDVVPALSKLGKQPFEDEGGASAFLMLSTSHAAVHGWPDRSVQYGWFQLSVSSCRDFSPEQVISIIRPQLGVVAMKHFTWEIDRVHTP